MLVCLVKIRYHINILPRNGDLRFLLKYMYFLAGKNKQTVDFNEGEQGFTKLYPQKLMVYLLPKNTGYTVIKLILLVIIVHKSMQ